MGSECSKDPVAEKYAELQSRTNAMPCHAMPACADPIMSHPLAFSCRFDTATGRLNSASPFIPSASPPCCDRVLRTVLYLFPSPLVWPFESFPDFCLAPKRTTLPLLPPRQTAIIACCSIPPLPLPASVALPLLYARPLLSSAAFRRLCPAQATVWDYFVPSSLLSAHSLFALITDLHTGSPLC